MGTGNGIEDRIEIQQVIQRYALACDSGRFELFREVFSDAAVLDYTAAGGTRGSREEIADWLERSRAELVTWQHHLSPPWIEVMGDSAVTRTDVYTPGVHRDEDGRIRILHSGGRYLDALKRTADGWRIVERTYENVWVDGAGASLMPDPFAGNGRATAREGD